MSGAMSGGMMVRLSKRMQALASMVTPGGVLADVGCDHGLLSVYLVKEGVVERAIATDLREGPLKRARESISAYCCQDRIETRLSDGLSALRPKEAEHILIAGMGGGIVLHILRDGEETARAAKELNMTVMDFFSEYCEKYIGDNSRLPVIRLKPRGTIRRCPLLENRRCRIHRSKPVIII